MPAAGRMHHCEMLHRKGVYALRRVSGCALRKVADSRDDPEHGDDGVRLCNLLKWRAGFDDYETLGNKAQEQAIGR